MGDHDRVTEQGVPKEVWKRLRKAAFDAGLELRPELRRPEFVPKIDRLDDAAKAMCVAIEEQDFKRRWTMLRAVLEAVVAETRSRVAAERPGMGPGSVGEEAALAKDTSSLDSQ